MLLLVASEHSQGAVAWHLHISCSSTTIIRVDQTFCGSQISAPWDHWELPPSLVPSPSYILVTTLFFLMFFIKKLLTVITSCSINKFHLDYASPEFLVYFE